MVYFKRSVLALVLALGSLVSAEAEKESVKKMILSVPDKNVRGSIERAYMAGDFDEVEKDLVNYLDEYDFENSGVEEVDSVKESAKEIIYEQAEETSGVGALMTFEQMKAYYEGETAYILLEDSPDSDTKTQLLEAIDSGAFYEEDLEVVKDEALTVFEKSRSVFQDYYSYTDDERDELRDILLKKIENEHNKNLVAVLITFEHMKRYYEAETVYVLLEDAPNSDTKKQLLEAIDSGAVYKENLEVVKDAALAVFEEARSGFQVYHSYTDDEMDQLKDILLSKVESEYNENQDQ